MNQKEEYGDDSGKDKEEAGEINVSAEEEDRYKNLGEFSFLQAVLIQTVARKKVYLSFDLAGK